MLAPFVKWLEKRDLVNFDLVTDDTDDGFATRFKIQKYVFIAQQLGLDTNYEYSRYRYGPYSPELTREYYRLGEKPALYDAESAGTLSERFRPAEFLETVRGRDNQWLEVATTLLDMRGQHNSPASLVDHVAWIKSMYPREYAERVLEDLRQTPISSLFSY